MSKPRSIVTGFKKRREAYEILVEKLKEMYATAKRETVVSKLIL